MYTQTSKTLKYDDFEKSWRKPKIMKKSSHTFAYLVPQKAFSPDKPMGTGHKKES